jgi:hypothetical protein
MTPPQITNIQDLLPLTDAEIDEIADPIIAEFRNPSNDCMVAVMKTALQTGSVNNDHDRHRAFYAGYILGVFVEINHNRHKMSSLAALLRQ